MPYSSIVFDPLVGKVFGVMTGMSVPMTQEGLLRESALLYEVLGNNLLEFRQDVGDLVSVCMSRFEGDAATAFAQGMARFTGGGGDDYLGLAAKSCQELADYAGDVANKVEYTKWMIIATLVQLLLEAALAEQMAIFTFGGSLVEFFGEWAVARASLITAMKYLAWKIAQHEFTNIAGGLVLDGVIQGAQIARGDRKRLDTSLTLQSLEFAAINGVMGGALAVVGQEFKVLREKLMAKAVADEVNTAKKVAAENLVNTGGKDLTKAGDEDLSKAGANALEDPASLPGRSSPETGGGMKPVLGDTASVLARAEAATLSESATRAFAQDITKLLIRSAPHLERGFKSAGVAGQVHREFAEIFARHLGPELGHEAAGLGESFGKAFTQGVGKAFPQGVGRSADHQAFRDALHEALKHAPAGAVTSRALAERLPDLAAHIPRDNTMFDLGFMVGHHLLAGVNNTLTEGFYNLIFGDGHHFTVTWQSFAAGVSMGVLGTLLHHPVASVRERFIRDLQPAPAGEGDKSPSSGSGNTAADPHTLQTTSTTSTYPTDKNSPDASSGSGNTAAAPRTLRTTSTGPTDKNGSVDGAGEGRRGQARVPVRTQSEFGGTGHSLATDNGTRAGRDEAASRAPRPRPANESGTTASEQKQPMPAVQQPTGEGHPLVLPDVPHHEPGTTPPPQVHRDGTLDGHALGEGHPLVLPDVPHHEPGTTPPPQVHRDGTLDGHALGDSDEWLRRLDSVVVPTHDAGVPAVLAQAPSAPRNRLVLPDAAIREHTADLDVAAGDAGMSKDDRETYTRAIQEATASGAWERAGQHLADYRAHVETRTIHQRYEEFLAHTQGGFDRLTNLTGTTKEEWQSKVDAVEEAWRFGDLDLLDSRLNEYSVHAESHVPSAALTGQDTPRRFNQNVEDLRQRLAMTTHQPTADRLRAQLDDLRQDAELREQRALEEHRELQELQQRLDHLTDGRDDFARTLRERVDQAASDDERRRAQDDLHAYHEAQQLRQRLERITSHEPPRDNDASLRERLDHLTDATDDLARTLRERVDQAASDDERRRAQDDLHAYHEAQ
ncbi:WXG100-like domain-containing protein, partial [Streptomyces sp. NPDC005122]